MCVCTHFKLCNFYPGFDFKLFYTEEALKTKVCLFEIKPTHVTQFVVDFSFIQAIKCLVRTILYPIGSL